MLHVRQECGPFVRQMHAAPQQVTGGAHVGGIDRGLREHAATEQGSNLLRINFVIFGLPAMDGFSYTGHDRGQKGCLHRHRGRRASTSSLESDVSHSQHTTGVCWGGGLNKYHSAAADALQRPLGAP